MAVKTTAEIQVVCYPQSTIPRRAWPGFTVADVYGDLMNLGAGDTQGLGYEGQNPTIGDAWYQRGKGTFSELVGVDFGRFRPDGVFQEGASYQGNEPGVSGFYLRGRIGYLDCKIGTTSLNTTLVDLNWDVAAGTWKTFQPPGAPARTWIGPIGTQAFHACYTRGDIAANRSLSFDLRFSIHQAGGQPAYLISWGSKSYAIRFLHGQAITIERNINNAWAVLRRLPVEADLNGGAYKIKVRRINGRLVISIGEQSWYVQEFTNPADPNAAPREIEATWPAGKIAVELQNVRALLSVSLIKYANSSDAAFTGSFVRSIPRKVPVDATGTLAGYPRGWKKDYTGVSPFLEAGLVSYTATLTATSQGIDTPFMTGAYVVFDPSFNATPTGTAEIGPFVTSAGFTMPSPPFQPGAEVTLEIDRDMLTRGIPTWPSYVQQYAPIEISMRHVFDDGTFTDWQRLFKGYIMSDPKQMNGFADHTMRLQCEDSLARLRKPAAVIDHRDPPLDIVLARAGDPATFQPDVYGSDCVRQILALKLGPGEADSLVTFFPPSHYPLYSNSYDTGGYFGLLAALGTPVSSSGFLFPAPYGSDAQTWIYDFCKYDRAIFYYGWPGDYDGEWPVPIYGRYLNITAGRSIKYIYDVTPPNGDLSFMFNFVSVEKRPEKDFNRILVWSTDQGSDVSQIMPALRMAEARLDPTDINAPENTWERTLIMRESLAILPEAAEFLATGTISQLANREKVWATFRFPIGSGGLQWGDKINAQLDATCPNYSDLTIGIHNVTMRVESVRHAYAAGGDSGPNVWTTEINTRVLSASGW